MTTELKQKISQFLDDDLNATEASHLLTELQHDNDALGALHRYTAVSQALQAKQFTLVDSDFASVVMNNLAEKPRALPVKPVLVYRRYVKFLALAASIAVLAVLLLHNFNQANSATIGQVAMQQDTTEPLNKQIDDYIHTHPTAINLAADAELDGGDNSLHPSMTAFDEEPMGQGK
jgi:hypothetical protein